MKGKKLNHKWERVTGENLQPQHAERGNKNSKTLKSPNFLKCCELVGINPTRRQASKFNNKRGLAYTAN